jgi:hypothetical protein
MSKSYAFLLFKKSSIRGLTLVEVIVGMLVSSLFLSTALQAYVAAGSIKAKAQKGNVAITTIHSDAETIRQIAQEIPTQDHPEDCTGNLGRKIIEKMSRADSERLKDLSVPQSEWSVSPIESHGDSQMIQQSSNWPLIPNSADYQFRRVLSADDDNAVNPSHLLHVVYEVTYRNSEAQIGGEAAVETKTVAKLRTSVMPNAALVCP